MSNLFPLGYPRLIDVRGHSMMILFRSRSSCFGHRKLIQRDQVPQMSQLGTIRLDLLITTSQSGHLYFHPLKGKTGKTTPKLNSFPLNSYQLADTQKRHLLYSSSTCCNGCLERDHHPIFRMVFKFVYCRFWKDF